MGIMRNIIKWCNTKQEQAYAETDNSKAFAKSFASGFVEGFCDGAIIMYPVLLIALTLANKANKDE